MNQATLDIHTYQTILEDHRDAFGLFEELLIDENKKFNLTRITSPQQVRTRHFLDSLAGLCVLDGLAKELQKPLRILDIGSGAGFPGLVLALARPDWSVVSLEATEKKARFQQAVYTALGLNNVKIIHGRAEELAHQPPFREQFDAVTARAVAGMATLVEVTLGFSCKSGLAVFWKGPNSAAEAADAEVAIKQMGAHLDKIISYTLEDETQGALNFSLVVCRKIKPTPQKYPRAFGLIIKKTLK